MSGLEIAGVVLATFPLVISAMEHYSQGITTAKRYWRYKQEMRTLITRIKTERHIFLNTCELLLTGIVPVERMDDFLNSPAGQTWSELQVKQRLQERLQGAYETCVEHVLELDRLIKKIMKKLKLDEHGQVQFTDPNAFKREFKRLRFSIGKADYSDLLDTFQRHNQALTQLTQQSLDLEPTRLERRSRSCPNFQAFRSYAISVYKTLRSGLRCPCPTHVVNLRLEARGKIAEEEEWEQAPLRVMFSYGSSSEAIQAASPAGYWKEAEIRGLKSSSRCVSSPFGGLAREHQPTSRRTVRFQIQVQPTAANVGVASAHMAPNTGTSSEPTPKEIQNLCHAISTLQPSSQKCIGYLENEKKQRHGIYLLESPVICSEQWSAFSLRDVLCRPSRVRTNLTQNDKLRLAVHIASSVLQLYKTPWLNERWSKDDVLFIHRPWARSLYDHPFVSHEFSSSEDTEGCTVAPPSTHRIIRNQTLFTLGVLLIELWYGRSIEELEIAEDHDCQGTPGITWCTADRLVDEIEYQAGKRYSDAVRRCVRCDFDRRDMSLDSEGFQEAVYNGVVALLEKDLNQFNGLD